MTINNLECINEAIQNEIDNLNNLKSCIKSLKDMQQLNTIINNIQNYNDTIYRVFEDNQNITDEASKIKNDNEILKSLLAETLTKDEKLYYNIKYNIQL